MNTNPTILSTLGWGIALILLGLGILETDMTKAHPIGTLIAALGVAFMLYRLMPGELSGEGKLAGMSFKYAGGLAGFVLTLVAIIVLQGNDKATVPSAQPSPSVSPGSVPTPTPVVDSQPKTGVFKMQAYCQMHDVYGFGQSDIFVDARNLAIQDCAAKGGVPACCAQNVSPVF